MNSKIIKGRLEFSEENYENALNYFNQVSEDDEDYMYVLIFKITCLMELEKYDQALFLIESVLNEAPEDELLVYEKIRCHIALNEKDEAFAALKTFENLISGDDKRMILSVSKFYKQLDDYENALKFCNHALNLDENFEEAVREKAMIGMRINDYEMINSSADKLFDIIGNNGIEMVVIFLLKLYISRFDDCLSIIDGLEGELEEDTIKMFKLTVLKELSAKVDAELYLDEDVEISIDEAIGLMKDYDDNGVDRGIIHGVNFKIM